MKIQEEKDKAKLKREKAYNKFIVKMRGLGLEKVYQELCSGGSIECRSSGMRSDQELETYYFNSGDVVFILRKRDFMLGKPKIAMEVLSNGTDSYYPIILRKYSRQRGNEIIQVGHSFDARVYATREGNQMLKEVLRLGGRIKWLNSRW